MERKHRILLAEDDTDFGGILKQYLEMMAYEITWAKNGVDALCYFKRSTFDICVLDVMMPEMDGFTLAENIIKINPEVPFLFLTARKMKEDKIRGLKLGADDYIVKPFEADELVLRIKNILSRSKRNIDFPNIGNRIHIGIFTFDSQRLELTHDEKSQRVTEKEGVLIEYLYKNRNQLLKRNDILQSVWGVEDFFTGRSMDVFLSRLRKYFKADMNIPINSIRGVGLEFVVKN